MLLALSSCQKHVDVVDQNLVKKESASETDFVKYTIKKGEQYCDLTSYIKVEYEELKFKVKFDSSAIYTTIIPSNQYDINKLFGFSDNNTQHHQNSARFGWNWGKTGLCLFAYTYNNGVRAHKLLGTVEIGAEINCSIKVAEGQYIFTLNDKVETMPRASTSLKSTGYKLYPYFGGDEKAPHEVRIWIKELKQAL
jgi:hypothetical protein